MPRMMSFAMTKGQMLNKTKTVTRRLGWGSLKAGDTLFAVDRVMGFRKGEKPTVLGMLRVTEVHREPLNWISQEDVIREGFHDMTASQFIGMFAGHYGIAHDAMITRIEFVHVSKYRPSNSTEGHAFMHSVCTGCKRLRNDHCGIQAATMWYSANDPDYPWQWQTDGNGAWCVAFDEGQPTKEAKPVRCKLTLDMFPSTLELI